MQHFDQARALFYMQSELIDTKIDSSVNKSINRVIEQIVSLRQEVHHEISSLRLDMHKEISEFKNEVNQRLSSVETALRLRTQVRTEIRNRFFDYSFKAGWLLILTLPGLVASFVLLARSFNF